MNLIFKEWGMYYEK